MAYTVAHPMTGAAVVVYVELDSMPLTTTGWHCRNPMTLRQGPARRGQDRLIPGAAGVRGKKRRPAPTPRTLELLIYGHQDWDDNPHTNYQDGLDTNIAHMRGVLDPAGGAGSSAITAELHLPDGSTTVTGSCHVEAFEIGPDAGIGFVTATIDVTLLAGYLS